MDPDPAAPQGQLTTQVAILRLHVELLERQLRRRHGLEEANRHWLERELDRIVHSTQDLMVMLVGDAAPP
jgi:hypothetical protein